MWKQVEKTLKDLCGIIPELIWDRYIEEDHPFEDEEIIVYGWIYTTGKRRDFLVLTFHIEEILYSTSSSLWSVRICEYLYGSAIGHTYCQYVNDKIDSHDIRMTRRLTNEQLKEIHEPGTFKHTHFYVRPSAGDRCENCRKLMRDHIGDDLECPKDFNQDLWDKTHFHPKEGEEKHSGNDCANCGKTRSAHIGLDGECPPKVGSLYESHVFKPKERDKLINYGRCDNCGALAMEHKGPNRYCPAKDEKQLPGMKYD
jgi:hypothetical protein